MSMHPRLRTLLDERREAGLADQSNLPIHQVRQMMRDFFSVEVTGAAAEMALVEELTIPSRDDHPIPATLYQPTKGSTPWMVYAHGGGWVKGDLITYNPFCSQLAQATGFTVLAVDYRLSPEHPFPAALEDLFDALVWAADRARAPLIIAGDSAGGNLAAATVLLSQKMGGPKIAAAALINPALDATMSQPSMDLPDEECLITRGDTEWYYSHYLGDRTDRQSELISPFFAKEVKGWPPTAIITAEYDVLRDEAELFAERLKADGVRVLAKRYYGMVHAFMLMGGLVEEARVAMEELAEVLQRWLRAAELPRL